MCWRPPQMATLLLVLAIAWILSMLAVQSDARFLEIGKRPPGMAVGIVPSDESDRGFLHLDPALSSDSRERASEMISVKLFNQYHARSFDPDDTEPLLVDHRPLDYETVNQLDADDGAARQGLAYSVDAGDTDAMDMKENVIDNDFSASIAPIAEQLDDWSEPATEPAEQMSTDPPRPTVAAAATTTMTTLTTTTTSTTMTTVRKVRRKIRRKLSMVTPSTAAPAPTTSTSTAKSTTPRRTIPTEPTTTTMMAAREPLLPKLDITKLNLQHLEDEFLSYPSLAGVRTASRLRPRSIKAATESDNPPPPPPSCGCQHRKRAAPWHSYSYEDEGDGEEYGDYDYVNDLRSRTPKGGAVLFPVMSRLLAPVAPDEHVESSVERAEKVHGALERLMGIVTIFSHVDEFIQKKTKQSIRRLARLYESEELY